MNKKYTQGYREIFYILVLIAILFQLYAITSSHWSIKKMKQKSEKEVLHFGLWKICDTTKKTTNSSDFSDTICEHLPPNDNNLFPKNSLYCVRIFSILSVCLLFASLMMLMYNQKYNNCQMVLLVASIICSIISSSVYGAELLNIKAKENNKVLETKFKPGYSYYLNILSVVPSIAALLYLKYTRF